MPHENILHQNILVPIGKRPGRYTLSLADYKLVLSGDVLISLEWIEGSYSKAGNGAIFLSAGFPEFSYLAPTDQPGGSGKSNWSGCRI